MELKEEKSFVSNEFQDVFLSCLLFVTVSGLTWFPQVNPSDQSLETGPYQENCINNEDICLLKKLTNLPKTNYF